MLLGGLQKLTLIDYPDKVACTVFTVGCNFRCHFCYNLELVDPAFLQEKNLLTEEYFFNFLSERKGILDGVCVTGGEPTVQPDLIEFIRKIKEMGFLVKLDTNGTSPNILKELLDKNLVDYVAMDIKNNLKSRNGSDYEKVIGIKVNIDDIKKSVEIIKNSGVDYEFRTTVVPGLHKEEDILAIAEEIKGAKRYYLQQFRQDEKIINPDFRKTLPNSKDFLEEVRKKIRDYFEACEVRGM